ncbi:MAG TPA: hypothetical protein PLR20_15605 [Syntrophales bacterium]|nr:hypothetical protein [Syntrophales bacterium]
MSRTKTPEETTFKGYPVLKIHIGKKYQSDEDEYLTLGLKKAQVIADEIDYIYRFVEKHQDKERRRR